MRKKYVKRKHDHNKSIDNEFRCDNIFKTSRMQPYLESTMAGKWGRGKDDAPVDEDEYPENNNPLPY